MSLVPGVRMEGLARAARARALIPRMAPGVALGGRGVPLIRGGMVRSRAGRGALTGRRGHPHCGWH